MTINETVLNPFSTNECSTSTPPENVRKPPVFSKSPNLLEKMVFYYHGTKNLDIFFSGTNWIYGLLGFTVTPPAVVVSDYLKIIKNYGHGKKRAY